MIALRCTECGQSIEIDESARMEPVNCAKCGAPILPERVSTDADFNSDVQTQKNADTEDTLSPGKSSKVEAFPFLAPPRQPGELGWLGQFRVERLLGQGGMGIVFEATDTDLQRRVALKVMKPEVAKDAAARHRFLREARLTAAVGSDHVVTIYHVSPDHGLPYFAMELLHGEPLDKWIEHNGRPSLGETLRIGIEAARGLAAAHELGLIHRDIKPANIWLETKGRGGEKDATPFPGRPPRVKILDFGLARVVREKGHLTHAGLVLGTPAYMAPEQAEGSDIDARSDLFSIGCVLYELATGAKPFTGSNTMAILMSVAMKNPLPPAQLNPDLPASLCDLILRMMAKRPQDRPPSAHEVVTALQAIADEIGADGQTPRAGLKRGALTMSIPALPTRRWPLFYWIAGGLLAVILLSLLVYALMPGRNPDIILGMSGPLRGPSRELGLEMEIGIKTYLKHVNSEGGVHGRKLKLVALDDGYEPEQALENMKRFKEQDVFAVLGNIGTPTAQETVPYAVANNMLFFGAFTGAEILRKTPPDRYVFNYRASYAEETARIVKYLVKIKHVKPNEIAVLDQNDAYGDAGFNGVVKVMTEKYRRAKNDIVRVRFTRNKLEGIPEAVQTILDHKEIRAVVMVGTYTPVTEFIRRLKDKGRDLIFANVSFVGSEALAELLLLRGAKYVDGVIVAQVVPPIDSGASIVLQYRNHLKQYYPNARPTFTSLEGYITTNLFVEGLKRAGPNATPESVIDTLETIENLDLGTGDLLTFSRSRHQASHTVWATRLDKEGKFQVLDMIE